MKALLFLLTILFAVWLWRRSRQNSLNQRQSKNSSPESKDVATEQSPSALNPSPMEACLHCGLHMPTADMLQGHRGNYCSQAHCLASSDTPK